MAFTTAAIMNLIHFVNGVIDRDNGPENLDASESNDLVCVKSLVDALTGAGKNRYAAAKEAGRFCYLARVGRSRTQFVVVLGTRRVGWSVSDPRR